MKDKKTKKGKKPLLRLFKILMKEYKFHIFFAVLGIIGTAFANVKGSLFLQTLIDDYITPLIGVDKPDFSPLLKAILTIGLVYLTGVVCSYIYTRIMVTVSQGTLLKIREHLYAHMERLPIRYFDTHAHGDILSIYTNDTDTLRQFISQSFPQIVNSIITIISVFISMIIVNVQLTVLSVILVLGMLLVSRVIGNKSRKYFVLQQKELGKVNGFIEEMINGQKVVKVFCHEEKAMADFKKLNEELKRTSYKANTYSNILMPVNAQLGNTSYVICAIAGALLTLGGYYGLTIGALVSFLTLNKSFNMPIAQVSMQLGSIAMASAGAERIFDLMDEEPERDEGYVTLVNAKRDAQGNIIECSHKTGMWAWKHFHKQYNTITFVEQKGEITMDGVDFGYVPEKTVLHDIHLTGSAGQKIAFVGSTGAGKTTITNLINRFYDIQDGKIRYDGININKIKKADLRKSLGMVLQDTHLFTGTVMDNIRYGNLDATDDECIAAAKLANAHDFIEKLPEGYDTVLSGDGGSLSQGQRQLLSIARAAVADPPVLILDEATSSIDTQTEALVQEGMDRLMKGRTTFVIAHRLSTVKNSDCIMVLEQGRIIERGNHQELMDLKGRYYQLYTGGKVK